MLFPLPPCCTRRYASTSPDQAFATPRRLADTWRNAAGRLWLWAKWTVNMLHAYRLAGKGLAAQDADAPLADAIWIDLMRPTSELVAQLAQLGVDVPTLADMEEIEISNRLYREGAVDYMTVVLQGETPEGATIMGPVCLILTPTQLVSVRHHTPRPFQTYPTRAEKGSVGCGAADEVFLGLVEEIVGRVADLLEGVGGMLDKVTAEIFSVDEAKGKPAALARILEQVGREGDRLGRLRLSMLTLDRALSFFGQGLEGRRSKEQRHAVAALMKDIQALEVHGDFLSNRVALASDATLGMINLVQSSTVRIVSVVAVLFLPPTLIASLYGMNFRGMPELDAWWGYPAALVGMVASAAFTYLFFRWKNWL
jgi:magnesium transporter